MSDLNDFNRLKNQAIDQLHAISSFATSNDLLTDLVYPTDESINQIQSDNFIVAVVGVIKRGKSTLLNALLQADTDILSTNVTPDTARLAFLTFAEQPSAKIITMSGKEISIRIEDLPEYTSTYNVLGGKGNKQKVEDTSYAEIYYPNDLLKKGFA